MQYLEETYTRDGVGRPGPLPRPPRCRAATACTAGWFACWRTGSVINWRLGFRTIGTDTCSRLSSCLPVSDVISLLWSWMEIGTTRWQTFLVIVALDVPGRNVMGLEGPWSSNNYYLLVIPLQFPIVELCPSLYKL